MIHGKLAGFGLKIVTPKALTHSQFFLSFYFGIDN